MTVNRRYARLLRDHHLTTFISVMEDRNSQVVKQMCPNRVTRRLVLNDSSGNEFAFYLKQHRRPTFRDYWKPLMRLTWPILGARNEWDAILRFHHEGLPTMEPVAIGEKGRESFLITAEIGGCRKLSDWQREVQKGRAFDAVTRRSIVQRLAQATRRMHNAGLHHQDYYLLHLLTPLEQDRHELYILDLGRAGGSKPLSGRWIVKDLAQLDSSTHVVSKADRLRFLSEYLGRGLQQGDRRLIARIQRKSNWISRRTRRN